MFLVTSPETDEGLGRYFTATDLTGNRTTGRGFIVHQRCRPRSGGRRNGGKSVTSSRNKLCVLATALGVAWLVTGAPAHAAGEKGEAKQECKQLLQDKGYKGVDVDQAKRTGEDRTRVEADATRNGNDRDVSCVYNSETDQAHIKK
jgi:hypothetical protein